MLRLFRAVARQVVSRFVENAAGYISRKSGKQDDGSSAKMGGEPTSVVISVIGVLTIDFGLT